MGWMDTLGTSLLPTDTLSRHEAPCSWPGLCLLPFPSFLILLCFPLSRFTLSDLWALPGSEEKQPRCVSSEPQRWIQVRPMSQDAGPLSRKFVHGLVPLSWAPTGRASGGTRK